MKKHSTGVNAEKIDILGVGVHIITPKDVMRCCDNWLKRIADGHQVVTLNPEFVMCAQQRKDFRDVLNNADLCFADGTGLFFASLFLYGFKKRVYRFAGVDFALQLAEVCAQQGKSLYLIGADPGIAEATAQALQKKYPKLIIAGAEEGIPKEISNVQFSISNNALLERIRQAKPDVLCVAFGAPKQELWIAEHLFALPSVRIAVGVGGTFDYLAGLMPYAPKWIRIIGFEWLHRLFTQPTRFNRIITAVIRFPLAVVSSTFKYQRSK
ncbi:WecB/TagA/CpsF family glycosyltransferase [Candidatus Uhrbacteria bacterium]|nr:WecB/TagA/CpsF family glycosyltransferase [Candidatus Uhrbacteria bacterium]